MAAPAEPVGLLLADKSAGPSSHDIVQRARRALGTRRVGHTGTLDPFATGLLLLLAGRATRLAEYFHRLPKAYAATLRLGVETRTHDHTGEPARESAAWREVDDRALEAALAVHRGAIRQRPPAFSAKRVEGRRAHRAARSGERVSLEPVPVTVHALELVDYEPPEARLRAVVSTGTYVRALARDVGRALGCGAHLTSLRRTAIGPFGVEEALPDGELEPGLLGRLDEGGASWWREPAAALAWLPRRVADDGEAVRIRTGRSIPAGEPGAPGGGPADAESGPPPVAVLHRGRLLAVAERVDGDLRPRKVFPDG